MARILNGKEFAARMKENAAQGVRALRTCGVHPRLAVIIVGNDPASEVYVRNKQKTCEELGILSDHIALPEETTCAELLACIDELNADEEVHGILVQLPLPAALAAREEEVLSRIDPRKDVDGFHPVNVGHLFIGVPGLRPCKYSCACFWRLGAVRRSSVSFSALFIQITSFVTILPGAAAGQTRKIVV